MKATKKQARSDNRYVFFLRGDHKWWGIVRTTETTTVDAPLTLLDGFYGTLIQSSDGLPRRTVLYNGKLWWRYYNGKLWWRYPPEGGDWLCADYPSYEELVSIHLLDMI